MTVSSFQQFKRHHYLLLAAVLIVILLLLSARYSGLKNQYGIETADSNDVTHPIDIKILITETLEVCKKTKDDHHAYCDEAVNSLERKLTYQDINAQRSMARSALGLLHLNFIQIVLGAVTFVFVGLAFWAAHRTADAAIRTAEAAESAERAYLIVALNAEIIEENRSLFEFFIKIKNYGRTPAHNIQGFLTVPANSPTGVNKIYSPLPKAIAAGGEFILDNTRVIGRIVDYWEHAEAERKIAGHYHITYEDVFGGERRDAVSESFSLQFDFEGWSEKRRIWQGSPIDHGESIGAINHAIAEEEWVAHNIKRIQINRWNPPKQNA